MSANYAEVDGGAIKVPKKFKSSSKITGAYDIELSDILATGHINLPVKTGSNSDLSGVIQMPQGKKRQVSTTDVLRRGSNANILSLSEGDVVRSIVAERNASSSTVDAPHKKSSASSTDFHDDGFVFNHVGLTSTKAAALLAEYGRNELAEKVIPLWYIFLEQLWQPMPLMIWAAVLVEIALGNYIDMGILIAIQFINAGIGFYEIAKAGDAVAALKASLKPVATVKRDGKFINIDAAEVVPGDLVLLACGSAVPADCRLNPREPAAPGSAEALLVRAGPTIDVDQAALTGESLPVTMHAGDSCKMGSTVVKGEEEGTVEFTGANTFFGKTAALLQSDPELSNIQKILIKVVLTLTLLSAVLCITVFIYLALNEPITVALDFTVVLMVASIPMAMEIVTTTTLSLGSKELSSHGAIVSRLAAIEDMAGMSILCSDKTGTLTLNKMVIQDATPTYLEGETQYTLLRYAAMAAKWMEPPRDALDTLTLTAADLDSLKSVTQLAYSPFDPVIKRTEGTIKDNTTGKIFKVSKGAPHILLKLAKDQEGYHMPVELVERIEKDVMALGEKGIRCLAVAKTNDDDKWEMLGLLTFLDPPRPDTKKTIEDALKYGVTVKMITGDHLLIARETARQLGMNDNIAGSNDLPMLDPETKKKPDHLSENYGDLILRHDGFAQVFPEHKYLIVECLRELGFKTGMTGDGVNDAPALKRADVGVAVDGATDAARAAADIVLTQPGLSTIIDGIVIARCIFVRIRNFITYRVAATIQLVLFFFFAVLTMRPTDYEPAYHGANIHGYPDTEPWPVFFRMPVLMLMLITLLNDGTLIAIGYDTVIPRKVPEQWNLQVLFATGTVLAIVACISSLLLLHTLLDSWNPNGIFQTWGIGGLSYGQITTSIYLKVSVSDFLTLFSARTGDEFFWMKKPANILMGAGCFSLTISTIIACTWPKSTPDGLLTEGLTTRPPYELVVYIWIYCLVWWLVQDVAKVYAYKVMRHYNLFEINSDELSLDEALEVAKTTATKKIENAV